MQRVLAQRGEIGDEDHGADGAGEIFRRDRERQRPLINPHEGEPGERQVGNRLQHAADPQAHGKRVAPRDESAGKPADQGSGEADALDDGGVVVAGKTEVDHEWRGHGAGKCVGEFVEHHEGERRESILAHEKFRECADRGMDHARECGLSARRGLRARRLLRFCGG